jgi:hypothetical protein
MVSPHDAGSRDWKNVFPLVSPYPPGHELFIMKYHNHHFLSA